MHLYNIYAQDEITLVENKLRLTLGSKIEHNNYTGFEYQPNARLAFTPQNKQLLFMEESHLNTKV